MDEFAFIFRIHCDIRELNNRNVLTDVDRNAIISIIEKAEEKLYMN